MSLLRLSIKKNPFNSTQLNHMSVISETTLSWRLDKLKMLTASKAQENIIDDFRINIRNMSHCCTARYTTIDLHRFDITSSFQGEAIPSWMQDSLFLSIEGYLQVCHFHLLFIKVQITNTSVFYKQEGSLLNPWPSKVQKFKHCELWCLTSRGG